MQYTLNVYLNDHKVCFGTVLKDHTIDILISEANDWAGKDNWNRLELVMESAE